MAVHPAPAFKSPAVSGIGRAAVALLPDQPLMEQPISSCHALHLHHRSEHGKRACRRLDFIVSTLIIVVLVIDVLVIDVISGPWRWLRFCLDRPRRF